jgi:hypothetical protein
MPSKKYLHDIDLVQNQLLNAVLDSRSSAPSSGVDGQIYYNNASKQFFYYNGTTTLWQAIAGAGLTNPMTALGDIIYGGASGAVTRLAGNITTTKQFLSQTGTGSASAAPTWATLAGSDITGAALTSSNDTNVTITLGGTPATSLLRAASLTLGWTGTLAVARGGTGLGTLGTANQLIRVNAGGTALEYFTSTFLTANQTITLTGVVTGSGTTSITTAIANGAITNAMLANGAVANLSGTNSGDNAVNSLYSGLVSNATHTGDATGATTLTVVALRGVALPALGASAGFLRYTGTGTNTWVFDTSVYITANQTITLSGNVTGSGTTAITTTIGTNVVTNAMLAQIASGTFHGRVTASTGNIENLTGTQATTLLDSFAGSIKGLVPVSVGGTTNFLRADGAWAAPAGGGGGGTPAGSNTQIQYNNSGAFGASASLTWDNSGQNLAIGSGTASAYLTILANNTSSGWAGRFWGDNATGQFYIQHRNNSGTFQTCLFFNGNTSGQTYMQDKAFVVGQGILMVNTTTDNGVDKLQVNGSMSVGSIKATGNVGIYNSSPFYALSVGDGTSTRQVVINGLNSGSAGGSSIAVQTNSLTTMMFGNKSNIIGGAYDGQPVFGFGGSTNSLQFYNFNTLVTSAMISSGDRFLIGTTTDNGVDRLQVNGSARISSRLQVEEGIRLGVAGSGQTLSSYLGGSNDSYPLAINAYVIAGVGWRYLGNGAASVISVESGDLLYYTCPTNSSGADATLGTFNQRFRVTAAGNFGIGTYAAPAAKLAVEGVALINTNTNNGVDTLQVSGSMIATSLKKSGGTSSQVLYADGGVKQITSGTAAPSGGNDGDIYLQYV